jgi:hypothetical protein
MSTLAIILIVVLILIVFGGWAGRGSYGSNAYYGPGIGLVGLIIVIVLILVLTGNLSI